MTKDLAIALHARASCALHGKHATCELCKPSKPLGFITPSGVSVIYNAGVELPKALSISLPHPPSVNHYWRHVGAKVLVSREGREYRKRVAALLLGTKPIEGPLSVVVAIHPPDRRRRDLDNVLKSLLDALQHGGAYSDDSQIARLLIERRDVVKYGKAVVEITATGVLA